METLARLDQRRRTVMAKLDRGYDDFVSGKISRGVLDEEVSGVGGRSPSRGQ